MSENRLFEPINVGNLPLGHRIVMAPLTRRRADPYGVPSEYAPEYYRQRAQYPGTLIISEGTVIHPKAAATIAVPQLVTEAQLSRWKEIIDAVHSQKSFIFIQLWAIGKPPSIPVAQVDSTIYAVDEGKYLRGKSVNELTTEEIKNYIRWFADAAYQSVVVAGANGVEIHGANGYLVEQFIRESNNHRTDEYGGSIENRTRVPREILDAVVEKLGDPTKVGFRISPWTNAAESRPSEETVAEYAYLLSYFQKRYPKLAYVSIVEPRLANGHADNVSVPSIPGLDLNEWNSFVRLIWRGTIIRAGGLIPDAKKLTNDDPNVLIAIGRYYISNPDIVHRLKNNIELTKYYRPTFYTPGPEGYVDYPNA